LLEELQELDRVDAHLLHELPCRIADRAAREQPHRPIREAVARPADQFLRGLEPMAAIDGTAEHDRVVIPDVPDLLDWYDGRVEAAPRERLADPCGDLAGRAAPGRRCDEDVRWSMLLPRRDLGGHEQSPPFEVDGSLA
jgi:hypothetical protein